MVRYRFAAACLVLLAVAIGFERPSTAAAVPGYSINTASEAPPTGVDRIESGGDVLRAGPLTFPFPVTFYGTQYSTAYFWDDGLLQFGPGAGEMLGASSCLPVTSSTPPPALYVYFDELEVEVGAGRGIFTRTDGSAPNRRFILEWRTLRSSGFAERRFAAVFRENSPLITTHYFGSYGIGATIGVQRNSEQYSEYSCNTTSTSGALRLDYVPDPMNAALPAISGTPAAGATLTASTGDWTGSGELVYAYVWRRCDAAGANCSDIPGATAMRYTAAAADVGSTMRVRVTATSTKGSDFADSAPTGTVAAVPPDGGGGGGSSGGGTGADTTSPVVRSLRLSPKRFRAARRGLSIAAATGSRATFALSEAAAVTFTVDRVLAGRRVGGRCVAPRRTNAGRKRCTRYVRVRGSFAYTGKSGPNRFGFTGRVRGKALRSGRHRLVATPRDAALNRGKPVRAAFTVRR
jgi:hypothetical protein